MVPKPAAGSITTLSTGDSQSEAYINCDQGYVTITVDDENVFSGMEEELPQ